MRRLFFPWNVPDPKAHPAGAARRDLNHRQNGAQGARARGA